MPKLTDEEKARRRAQADKDRAERRAKRERESEEAKDRTDKLNAERRAKNRERIDQERAEDKKRRDNERAAQKIIDDENKAADKRRKDDERAADKKRRDDQKASDKLIADKRKADDKERAASKKAFDDFRKQREKNEAKWRKDGEKDRERAGKRWTTLQEKWDRNREKEDTRLQKVHNRIAQAAMVEVPASQQMHFNAGSQLSHLLANPHGIDESLGKLPTIKEHAPLWADTLAHTDIDDLPAFDVPKSKQSFLNRISKGRWDRVSAPGALGPAPPPDNRGFLRRTKDGWDSGVDRLAGARDSIVDSHKMRTTDKLFEALKGNVVPAALGAGVMGATAGLGMLGGALGLVKKAFFATWDYIDTKVLPTQSMLNRSLGTSTEGMKGLRGEAMSTGLQFERLGLGFEHGAQTVKDIAVAMRSADISKSGMKTLVTAAEYTGIGGENAGSMARSFQAAGMSIEDLGDAFKSAQIAAEEFDVPVALIQKEFGENRDALARWGAENSLQFNRAIGRAQHYGLSINDLENSFGEAMDSFETSSDVASKINQTFGTNLDSIRLMNASDDERMEMVQKAIKQTGFVASAQTKYYNNLIKASLGLKGADDVLRLFGKGATSTDAKKRIDEQEALAKGTAAWNKGLASLGMQLTSVEQLSRNFFMAIGNVVAKLLGFKSGIDATKTGVKAFETFMDRLTGKINSFANKMPGTEDGQKSPIESFFDNLNTSLENLRGTAMEVMDIVRNFTHIGEGAADTMSDQLAPLLKDPNANREKILEIYHSAGAKHDKFDNTEFTRFNEKPETVIRSAFKSGMKQTDLQDMLDQLEKNGRYITPSQDMSKWEMNPTFNVWLDSEKMEGAVSKAQAKKGVVKRK